MPFAVKKRFTTVAIRGDMFLINGKPTYPGRCYNGMKIEGLLFNSRMVQGIFDDRNPETRSMWTYPDGSAFSAERNTQEFLDAMPIWRKHGLLGFTINLQGGNPRAYGKEHPWHNSAFEPDGALREDYMARLERILDRADELGMVPIVGYFYFGQDNRLAAEKAIVQATMNATQWLLDRRYHNILVEIANESNVGYRSNPILRPERAHELILMVKSRSAGKCDDWRCDLKRLLVSTSMGGGHIPEDNVVAAGDFILVHGNRQDQPQKIRDMVDATRKRPTYTGQPIVFNEDDHFDFDAPDNNMLAATGKYASWGYFDYRMKDESFDEGYQSVPVNWQISSARKRGFFDLLSKVTGSDPNA
jgi:hypothetical protein